MCFSAGVSLGAAAVLFIMGILTLAYNRRREYRLFSLIPLFFAVQQFTEGIVWVSLQNPAYSVLQIPATYLYLIFALLIWPILMPLSLLQIEKHRVRRHILTVFLVIGILWSVHALVNLFLNQPSVELIDGHLLYGLPLLLGSRILHSAVYMAITVLPFFATHIRSLWVFGGLIFGTALVSYLIWATFFVSIWCFFAALVSLFVCLIVRARAIRDDAKKGRILRPVSRAAKAVLRS